MSNHQSLEDSDLASPESLHPRVPKSTGKRGERQDAIPRKSVYRLSIYQRCLRKLKDNHVVTVSSEALARAAGVKSTQLRKDLAYFGQFGPVLWAPGNVRLRMIVRAERGRRKIILVAASLAGGESLERSMHCSSLLSPFRILVVAAALAGLVAPLWAGVPVMSGAPPAGPVRKGQVGAVNFVLSEPAPAGGVLVDYRMGEVPGQPVAVLEDDFRILEAVGEVGWPGRIFFPAGAVSAQVRLLALEDALEEPVKWARFLFRDPRGLTLAPGLAVDVGIGGGPAVEQFFHAEPQPAAAGSLTVRRFTMVEGMDPAGLSLPGVWGLSPSLAVADVIPGDGQWEYIVGSGEGVPGRFAVFSAAPGGLGTLRLEIVPHALPNGQAFTGGMWLAAADFNNDGVPDIVTVPRNNTEFGSPGTDAKVQIWDVWRSVRNDGGNSNWRIWERTLAAPVPGIGQTAGFHVAAGDVTGDGVNDVIIGNGPGLSPMVQVWSYTGNFQTDPSGFNRTHLFPVFNMEMDRGVFVSTGDFNEDGRLDLIAGSGSTRRTLSAFGDGDVWQGRAWDGIHHVKVQDITTGAVLFDRQMGDFNGNGVIDKDSGATWNDPSDDTFVFGGRGFAGFMRPPYFTARTAAELNDTPGHTYVVTPAAGNPAGPVLWAPGNVRLRMIVRALPVTVAGPVVKLPAAPAWPGALQPGTTMQPHQRNGVPGQRVVFAHRSTPRGYLPVMEASADLLSWEQVDPRMVTAYDYDSQELFIPDTQIAAQPKRFYRGRFIHLDATP